MIFFEILYSFGDLFVACEMGTRITVAFAECSEMIEQFEWYRFPTRIRRMMPMILMFTQQPIEIICFGSTGCDRETFKSVSVEHILHLLAIETKSIQLILKIWNINR